jgi:hypothetical protein
MMEMEERPSISEMTCGFMFFVSSSVAQVRRTSWRRISGSPARLRSREKERLRRFEGLIMPPASFEDEAAGAAGGAHPLHFFELAGEIGA